MRRLLLLIALAGPPTFCSCASYVLNPFTGQLDCNSAGGAGSGTVTSVGLAGTANQLTVTGASPITASGSWTISIPSVLTLPGTVNKITLSAPTTAATLAFPTDNATITFQGTDTYVGRATTDTLTNKTLTSPLLTTPTLGVATGTSLALGGCTIGSNGLCVTGSVSLSGSISTGVGGSVAGYIQLGQGTLPSNGTTAVQFVAPTSVTSYQMVMPSAAATGFILNTDASNTETWSFVGFSGTGNVARVASPTFTTPTLGAASATTINKVTLTAPASGSTLTIVDGKTLTANNSITLAGTDSTTMTFPSTSATITRTVASGTKALSTSAISSGACTAAQTITATGTLTTDTVVLSFNGDPTGVTGYIPSTNGMLTIIGYPTADTINIKVCNNTSSSITPGAITLNGAVYR